MDINKKSALISRLRHTTTLVESNYHPQMNSSARGASSSASSGNISSSIVLLFADVVYS